jgi:hypothetical protein
MNTRLDNAIDAYIAINDRLVRTPKTDRGRWREEERWEVAVRDLIELLSSHRAIYARDGRLWWVKNGKLAIENVKQPKGKP